MTDAVRIFVNEHPRTVPAGVTLQDWVAWPPSLVVAVTVKALPVRDWEAVGVQESVLPLRLALAGEMLRAKDAVPPDGSVAEIA